jgi:hypothetical protein
MSGPRRPWRRPRVGRLVVGTALALLMVTWSTTAVSADDTTTTTEAMPNFPPAPPGFAATLLTTYQSVLNTATALGAGQALESSANFQQEIDGLDANSLAGLYYATQQIPEFSEIPALMQTVASGVSTSTTLSAARTGGAEPQATLMAKITRTSGSAAVTPAPAVLTDTKPVNPYMPTSCDTTDYDAPIFALQIVLDVANGVYDGVSPFAHSLDPFSAGPEEDVASVVAAVVAAAAAIVHDTLVYLQTLENECEGNNTQGYLDNIDNTTVASYNLITTLSVSTTTIQTNIQNIQQQINVFQTTIEQALASDTQTLQETIGGDTGGTTTTLQIIQTALQNDITTIENLETTNGQQVVAGTTKIQTALSTDLTQILNETDTDAQGLTTLVTQGNQNILNALQSNFSAAQQQYENTLQIEIEQGLAGWAPVVPEVQLMLPVSMGGLLNATPVGVQEVVTSDIAALQAQGVKVKAIAITDLSSANSYLTAGNYTSAWSYYAQAYQAAA